MDVRVGMDRRNGVARGRKTAWKNGSYLAVQWSRNDSDRIRLTPMSRRIDIELTSARPDGTWTWRAAGAQEPKGVLEGSILPGGSEGR